MDELSSVPGNDPSIVPVAPPPFSIQYEMDNSRSSQTLTEPVLDTIKRDLFLIYSNLKLVVIPNPYRDDPGKALRDWDLWGPFIFVLLLGINLSWSASIQKVISLLFLFTLS